jgi:hypothetical protein
MRTLSKPIFLGLLSFLTFLALDSCAEAKELAVTNKEGEPWVTIEGTLMKVNMTAVKDVWEEYALKLDDGEVVILIGAKVSKLENKVGTALSLSGILKPRFRYAGELVRTVEVREIQEPAPREA